jgi:hypothetical protein
MRPAAGEGYASFVEAGEATVVCLIALLVARIVNIGA